ncbi:MAG: FkbM family methyltransferase, partial [Longimicrobiales bacterium]
ADMRNDRRLTALWSALGFKSQKGQDRWVIFEVFRLKRGGFFVELAAANGVLHSNTYALEKFFQWDGICIEPNPRFHEELGRRRRCRIDTSVVDERDSVVLFRVDNGQLGGIVSVDTDNNSVVRAEQLKVASLLSLRAEPLASILDRHAAPAVIDYLSLDVEGSEERVLRSFPFDSYRFRCMTIERPTPRLNQVLAEAGYRFVRNVRFDTFYVHESEMAARSISCARFQQVPPKDW